MSPRLFICFVLARADREIALIQDEAESDWRDVPGAGGETCQYQYDHSEKGVN